MKHFKIKDVPKGQRLSYYLTYYKGHTVAAVVTAALVIWLIYMFFFHPHADMSILWVGHNYDAMTDTIFREDLNNLPCDLNEDGKVNVALQYIQFPEDIGDLAADTRMTIIGLLSSQTFNVYLVNEAVLQWFSEGLEVLGTWSDYAGYEVENGDEIFYVPCSELAFFQNSGLEDLNDLYVAIGAAPTDPEALAIYRKEIKALKLITEN